MGLSNNLAQAGGHAPGYKPAPVGEAGTWHYTEGKGSKYTNALGTTSSVVSTLSIEGSLADAAVRSPLNQLELTTQAERAAGIVNADKFLTAITALATVVALAQAFDNLNEGQAQLDTAHFFDFLVGTTCLLISSGPAAPVVAGAATVYFLARYFLGDPSRKQVDKVSTAPALN